MIGTRQYSRDLVQGGLEVPCKLKFTGDHKLIEKINKLIKDALTINVKSIGGDQESPPEKKLKLEPTIAIKKVWK